MPTRHYYLENRLPTDGLNNESVVQSFFWGKMKEITGKIRVQEKKMTFF